RRVPEGTQPDARDREDQGPARQADGLGSREQRSGNGEQIEDRAEARQDAVAKTLLWGQIGSDDRRAAAQSDPLALPPGHARERPRARAAARQPRRRADRGRRREARLPARPLRQRALGPDRRAHRARSRAGRVRGAAARAVGRLASTRYWKGVLLSTAL